MTAQIAILNKNGFAMASDTAVTIQISGSHPVGVMNCGKALICGVPFDTLFKLYADKLGSEKFPKLEDYAHSFLNFLQNHPVFTQESLVPGTGVEPALS